MNRNFVLHATLLTILIGIVSGVICGQSSSQPRVFLLSGKALAEEKRKVADPKDASTKPALAKIERDAQKALKEDVLSIVTKTATPPSGDKHDYMTQAPYFWKNPDTKDGLPYVQRDGERNPEIKQFPDHERLDKMESSVVRLATAYYFTGKEEYAAKAAEILRMWFVDPKTKMNPNLDFAQAVPGKNNGRGIGIIETRELVRVVDAIGLLNGAKSWSRTDQANTEAWFAAYLRWLMESKNGLDESKATNNHGTFYDVQVISFALFTHQTDLAKKVLESAKQNRIARQIEPDGGQPRELARTKSWSYSTMNLDGMVELAQLGDAGGVDIWDFQTSDGRSVRKAIDYLYPYAKGDKKWTFQQIEEFQPERLYTIMRRAARAYHDEGYNKMMTNVPKLAPNDEHLLLMF